MHIDVSALLGQGIRFEIITYNSMMITVDCDTPIFVKKNNEMDEQQTQCRPLQLCDAFYCKKSIDGRKI